MSLSPTRHKIILPAGQTVAQRGRQLAKRHQDDGTVLTTMFPNLIANPVPSATIVVIWHIIAD
jgi:hypothetical protein